jgi:ribulose-bisphosphate carboxylase large chain
VRQESYKSPDASWAGIARYVLFAGSRGDPLAFDVRYFEIESGGYSTLEHHRHAHVVIGLRGQGRVRIGRRWRDLKPLDACYIGPETAHQLRNEGGEPFGFLCLVDAARDHARPVRRARKSGGERK